jgi:hypothetical protein
MFRDPSNAGGAAPTPRPASGPTGPSEAAPGEDLTSLPLERIETEITELAAHIYAATCRWLTLVAEFDRRQGHEAYGFPTCAGWLAWRCGASLRAARDQVQVARCLRDLPAIRSSFGQGQLSYSKVRALIRVATPESEDELLELARHATAAQLERIVGAYRRVSVSDANRARERRHLSSSWEDDGSLVLRGCLAPEEGALFLRALDAARDDLRSAAQRDQGLPQMGGLGGTAVPPQAREDTGDPPAPTNADALASMAERSLAGDSGDRSGGDRYQVVVHVDANRLADDGADGRCGLEDGPAIAAETARRLACDASLVAMHEADGAALSVGRKTRTIPPSLRRALRARDEGCRFPGCTHHRFTDAHHIHHWALGGETSLDNLVTLCHRHHRLLHEGGFTLEGKPDGELLFRRPNGKPLPPVPSLPSGHPDAVPAANRHAGLQVNPETCASLSAGESFDLDLTVMGLVSLIGPEPP